MRYHKEGERATETSGASSPGGIEVRLRLSVVGELVAVDDRRARLHAVWDAACDGLVDLADEANLASQAHMRPFYHQDQNSTLM